MRKTLLALALLLALGVPARAAFTDDIGGVNGAFLLYGGTPRTLAMGKAFTALANDAEAGYFNPAGLSQLNSYNLKLAHSQLFEGLRYEYLSYAMPTRLAGSYGLTLVGDWATALESRDEYNFVKPTWDYMEAGMIFTAAYAPWKWLGLGTNLKLVGKVFDDWSGVGAGIDLGAMIMAPKPLQFGIVVQNVLPPTMTLSNQTEVWPTVVRAGAAARFYNDRIAVTADVVKVGIDTIIAFLPHGGLEFEIVPDVFTARAGLDMNDFSGGAGIKQLWGDFGIGVDYAILLHHRSGYLLPPTHKAGLSIEFGGYRTWIDATPEVFSPTPDDRQNVLFMDIKIKTRRPVKRWQILIKNELGEVVRTYASWDHPPLREQWDGLDDAGRMVADGKYFYDVVLVDDRGASMDHFGFLTRVLTRGPQGKVRVEKER